MGKKIKKGQVWVFKSGNDSDTPEYSLVVDHTDGYGIVSRLVKLDNFTLGSAENPNDPWWDKYMELAFNTLEEYYESKRVKDQ